MFELEIETNNEAFVETGGNYEIARILRRLSEKIGNSANHRGESGNLIDSNGNKVGSWTWSANE